MTQVTFHFNAPDKTAYACRLLRKASASGARVVVTGEPEELDQLDTALWTFSAQAFIPHCRGGAPDAMLQSTPIILVGPGEPLPPALVLVRLGGPAPAEAGEFQKIIELVGQGESDRLEARQRWRDYAAQGHTVAHHDVAQPGRPDD